MKGSVNESIEELETEECRLKREKERISVEQSYIAEEEKILAEQSQEMETVISSQTGDTTDRRTALQSKQGTYVLRPFISNLHVKLNRVRLRITLMD